MANMDVKGNRSVTLWAAGVSTYLLFVILWGAYVRVTGSGAGCGNHWPLCNGEVIPRSPETAVLIEFTHRLTSGLGFILVVILVVVAFKAFPRRSNVRLAAGSTLFFMITEALLGAGLVLFGLVAEDDSLARAWVIGFHLANTLLLLASSALTGWWASGRASPRLTQETGLMGLLALTLGAFLLLSASGAVTALGDTLFPPESLGQALQTHSSEGAHFLKQLRIYHPLLALAVALLTIWVATLVAKKRPGQIATRLASITSILFLVQLGVGVFNFLLLAPAWLQLLHLLTADLTWISLVLLSAAALETIPLSAARRGAPAKPRLN